MRVKERLRGQSVSLARGSCRTCISCGRRGHSLRHECKWGSSSSMLTICRFGMAPFAFSGMMSCAGSCLVFRFRGWAVRRADSSPSCSPSCKYSCIGCATLVPHCDRSEPSHTRTPACTHARTHTALTIGRRAFGCCRSEQRASADRSTASADRRALPFCADRAAAERHSPRALHTAHVCTLAAELAMI